MRQITSSSLSNQSLTTALLCHTYTADADRDIFFRLFADQVAGNGVYTAYITIQRLGAGSAYEVQPRTAPTVASGVTAIAFTTVSIPVKNTDVVKVYLLGLAGDTTTPDIVTEVWEADYARPITAGQYATNIDSSGRVTVGSIAAGAITAAAIATGAVDADALATDAVTEIAAGIGASLELGAGSITEETFADGAISSRVITTAAAVQAASVASGEVTARRGDSWVSVAITTTAHDWDSGKSMRLLLKSRGYIYASEADVDAYLGILLTQSGGAGDGLYLLNQTVRSSAGDLDDGSLVRSSSTQTLVNVAAVANAQLAPDVYSYELQVAESDGSSVVTIAAGQWTVTADVVRATA